MSCLLVEKEPGASQEGGLTIPPQLQKLGYKGVETTELVFADHRVPGGEPARRRGGRTASSR